MNISATLLGEIMVVFVLLIGALSYYLGRRKTQTPIAATVIGVLLALFPPFAMVYLIVLVCKKDLATQSVSQKAN
ncbi:hypothetical protein [Paraglaciecola sp.]|uniref:hypothetical protein n=1 Tax=Paraglaciecola sp. TaxID=1920173 RepID=UPI00273EE4EE|nr:hypothetical protein [Paraglaciecola sp.]MDP5033047.1 hypothetical protein [Paraglaciecola sp.]